MSSIPSEPITTPLAPPQARRLLIISYHFPPDGAVGGLRWAGLTKYLARLGWEVHVVTAADGPTEPTSGVHRHHRARRRTLNDRYKSLAGRARRPGGAGQTTSVARASERLPESPSVLRRLSSDVRILGSLLLDFPDDGRGWVIRAAAEARALLRRSAFDVVVTSGPPHSAHFAGILATIGSGVPHVIDMRDPWRIMSHDWPGYAIRSPLFGHLERAMFRFTRHVVVNTREFAETLQAEQPRLAVSLVTNGTDVESLPRRSSELFDGLSIAYAGTVYIGRSFTTLLPALESLRRERPDDAAKITLRIAGQMGDSQREQLQAELCARGLQTMVELRGAVPRSDALDLLRRSHVALVLAQGQPTQVPAKLYECVGLGVPTLVIAEPTSAASREGRRIGAMTIAPDDVRAMRQLLDDLLDGRVPTTIAPAAPVSYEALARQMDRLLRMASAPAAGA